jgi:uncharacterized protein DUF5655
MGALWRCPDCGQTFVARNMPHSCRVVALDAHFEHAAPALRGVFDALLAAVRALGPVTVNATASRITFQAQMRFAGVERPRRDHLPLHFVLTRAIRSERLRRVEYLAPSYYVHRLRLRHTTEIDAELRAWLAEAYAVGERRHVTDPDWPREREPPDWVHLPR